VRTKNPCVKHIKAKWRRLLQNLFMRDVASTRPDGRHYWARSTSVILATPPKQSIIRLNESAFVIIRYNERDCHSISFFHRLTSQQVGVNPHYWICVQAKELFGFRHEVPHISFRYWGRVAGSIIECREFPDYYTFLYALPSPTEGDGIPHTV